MIIFDFMDDTITAFTLSYGNELTLCVAVMRDTWFDVFLNNRPVAELVMNGERGWMLAAGVILPDDIVYKIGWNIEARYM